MASQPVTRFTAEEYLAFERAAEVKHEFLDGELYAMSGASMAHSRLSIALAIEVGGALSGSGCEAFDASLRVRVSATAYFYPDLTVVCGAPQLADENQDALLNPRVVFEILSPSTEKFDRGRKFQSYREMSSITDYVLVSQEEMRIEHYTRGADGAWTLRDLQGPEAVLSLAMGPGIAVPLARIYRAAV